MTKRVIAGLCALLIVPAGHNARAQDTRTFRVRLSPVPVDGPPMMATIAGLGAATVSLAGSRLTVEATFRGLKSSATFVKLHRGPRGIRGPAVLDLPAPPAAKDGKYVATVELSRALLDDLHRSRLYLQLYSESAPDGNLWGWLLPQEEKP